MKWITNELSVKSRLSLMLIVVTLISSFVVGLLGWRNGQNALEKVISAQLTSARSAQAYHVEGYFNNVFSHARTLSEDRMVVNAMKQFQEGFGIGLYRSLTPEQDDTVTDFYSESFAPRLSRFYQDAPLSIMFRPKRSIASYFQYHYIVNNPYPSGSKDLLSDSKLDTTIYNRFHKYFHPLFRNIQQEFNFYDIFLIDIKSLNVIYSVSKETDFATSLEDGPYRESGLGVLANNIKTTPERGSVSVVDFRAYAPSYGAPAAFIGSPIYDGNEAVGIFALQLPASEINRAMTYNENWVANGLGMTGESYIVGSDRLMRTDARLLIEENNSFYKSLKALDYSDLTIRKIQNFNTTNLLMPAVSSSVQNAFNGLSGTQLTTNYLGQSVLSSYAPLNIKGLDWVILTEITESESFEPIAALQRNILMWGVVLVLGVALLSMLLSRYFVRPIDKLTEGVESLAHGNDDVFIDIQSKDEFGALASSFNSMVGSIRRQTAQIQQKETENGHLLLNMFPASIAARLRAGESVADHLQQASVAYLHVKGFSTLSDDIGVEESARVLETILFRLDDLAQAFEVETVNTISDTFIAVSGLDSARVDHANRIIEFSIEAIRTLEDINNEHKTTLSLQIGVATGAVMAGVIGNVNKKFKLWGKVVDVSSTIYKYASSNGMLVTNDVLQRVELSRDINKSSQIKLESVNIDVYELTLQATDKQKSSIGRAV